jgi:hypothetical protein|tara:strand:+ start:1033 stop:1239 length:207 start_codon:yes stop_codon:yes gene_type:complete
MDTKKIDKEFEQGLFHLRDSEHLIIKKALSFYMSEKQYKDSDEFDNISYLYGDLNRTEESKEMDDQWL